MPFENLFIRTKRSIGDIQLDAVISETHSNKVRITKNPVEFGADINDHAIIEPKKLTIVGVVSDTPMGAAAALNEIVDTVTGLFGSSTSENITRSQQAYSTLIALQESREPLQVQTKLVLYDSFLITAIDVSQDKDTSRKVDFNISLEEVIIVDTNIISTPASSLLSGSTREQATTTKKIGKQIGITPTDSEQRKASFLYGLIQ